MKCAPLVLLQPLQARRRLLSSRGDLHAA
jgi:hypothetical protein